MPSTQPRFLPATVRANATGTVTAMIQPSNPAYAFLAEFRRFAVWIDAASRGERAKGRA
jgi:hypothetical protein